MSEIMKFAHGLTLAQLRKMEDDYENRIDDDEDEEFLPFDMEPDLTWDDDEVVAKTVEASTLAETNATSLCEEVVVAKTVEASTLAETKAASCCEEVVANTKETKEQINGEDSCCNDDIEQCPRDVVESKSPSLPELSTLCIEDNTQKEDAPTFHGLPLDHVLHTICPISLYRPPLTVEGSENWRTTHKGDTACTLRHVCYYYADGNKCTQGKDCPNVHIKWTCHYLVLAGRCPDNDRHVQSHHRSFDHNDSTYQLRKYLYEQIEEHRIDSSKPVTQIQIGEHQNQLKIKESAEFLRNRVLPAWYSLSEKDKRFFGSLASFIASRPDLQTELTRIDPLLPCTERGQGAYPDDVPKAIHIRNLPHDMLPDELRLFFDWIGPIKQTVRKTGYRCYVAAIHFELNDDSCGRAMSLMDGYPLTGRRMTIQPVRSSARRGERKRGTKREQQRAPENLNNSSFLTPHGPTGNWWQDPRGPFQQFPPGFAFPGYFLPFPQPILQSSQGQFLNMGPRASPDTASNNQKAAYPQSGDMDSTW